MDWKTFVAEIINTLSWPLVVIFIIMQLKDKLVELLPRLKRVKYKDTELEFKELIEELSPESNTSIKVEYKSKEVEENKKVLYTIASVSPRSAIIEAYRLLEVMAIKAIEKAYPDLKDKNIKSQVQVAKMLRDKVLNSEQYYQLRELRNLRNNATHNEEFSLTGKPIEAYINLALVLTDELAEYINS